jgi:hypothetical protein
MAPTSLLDLPKELLSQVLDSLTTSELCQPAQANGILNILCERLVYQKVSVVKYAYSHVGKTNYDAIRCFFNAIKKQPRRLSYIKEVTARLELRMDSGLYHACELFEVLPKMPQLTDLCLEVVGGINYRQNRSLEQSFVWGCTFERGRLAVYKFFRSSAETGSEALHGLHALNTLRRLKVTFPSASSGLQTDLIAYSALQHKSITRLELKHIVNASLAAPKLPRASGAITQLTLQDCQLPLKAYQSILESISALEYLDYRPARPMGGLGSGGLVKALAHHSKSIRSLSIKTEAHEMSGMDLAALTNLTHLQVHNPSWDENAMDTSQNSSRTNFELPAVFPPCLETLTLQNYHAFSLNKLTGWTDTTLAMLKPNVLPHLKELRLEAEYLGDENNFDDHPMFLTSASSFHVNDTALALGTRLYREAGVKLSVKETLHLGQEGHTPGPYEIGPDSMTVRLIWDCRPQFEGSADMVRHVRAEMSPAGAVERFLLL